MEQIRQEKRNAFDKTNALFEFVNQVIARSGTSGAWDEQCILNGIDTNVAAVIDAFSPGLEFKARNERIGRLKILVQRFLSKALGY